MVRKRKWLNRGTVCLAGQKKTRNPLHKTITSRIQAWGTRAAQIQSWHKRHHEVGRVSLRAKLQQRHLYFTVSLRAKLQQRHLYFTVSLRAKLQQRHLYFTVSRAKLQQRHLYFTVSLRTKLQQRHLYFTSSKLKWAFKHELALISSSEVLRTTWIVKITVFWYIEMCSLVARFQPGNLVPPSSGQKGADVGSRFLRNARSHRSQVY
jgi:hypothetical protein